MQQLNIKILIGWRCSSTSASPSQIWKNGQVLLVLKWSSHSITFRKVWHHLALPDHVIYKAKVSFIYKLMVNILENNCLLSCYIILSVQGHPNDMSSLWNYYIVWWLPEKLGKTFSNIDLWPSFVSTLDLWLHSHTLKLYLSAVTNYCHAQIMFLIHIEDETLIPLQKFVKMS